MQQYLKVVTIVENKNEKGCLFCLNADSVAKFNMENGSDWHTVASFGAESGGKSTALNFLFGTRFPVMDASISGVEKCTNGILMAYSCCAPVISDKHLAPKSSPTSTSTVSSKSSLPSLSSVSAPVFTPPSVKRFLVFDLQGYGGFSSRDYPDFDSKAALFAMAMAEVLIVNIRFQQLNLMANYELLKTVSEQALKTDIMQGQKRTLLFLLRDYEIYTKEVAEKNVRTIKDHLEKIWGEIKKPAGKKDMELDMYFTVVVCGVPDLRLKTLTGEQKEMVDELNRRFKDDSSDGYLFKENMQLRSFKATQLVELCASVWSTVDGNEELNVQELIGREEDAKTARETLQGMDGDIAAFEKIMGSQRWNAKTKKGGVDEESLSRDVNKARQRWEDYYLERVLPKHRKAHVELFRDLERKEKGFVTKVKEAVAQDKKNKEKEEICVVM